MRHIAIYEDFNQGFGPVLDNPRFHAWLEKEGIPKAYWPKDEALLVGGWCGLVARWMASERPGSTIWAAFVSMGLYHAAAEIDGRFYDALNPDGVDDLESLEFLKKDKDHPEMKQYKPGQFARKYREEYKED